MAQILEFIGCLLELIIDFQFWRDKKKRRKFEKENNLPKKIMIHPYIKILAYSILITTPIIISFTLYQHYYSNTKKTIKKISQVESLLIENKEVDGVYPNELEDIIRNNPLRKNITLDGWGNEFHYSVLDHEKTFNLISKGKDGILNTEDDIKASKKH
ncbi:type II secretion system protein GspG [Algibacter sp. R77976]|uniref:type II secretion system protein GspG n=1 Tax=Algibacter sp. R77976 TaxID=3093873 RepID=UPI0037C654F2